MEGVKTIFLLGRPGSGKGTQTMLLAEKLGWRTLSSGNTFRELRSAEGPLGQKVREMYDAGILFPHWFPVYLFQNAALNMQPSEGLICEGFARSVDEAAVYGDVLGWLGRPYLAINLDVSEEEAIRRQMSRNETDARPDSNTPEKIQKRLSEYNARTEPVLEFFKGQDRLIQVNGEQTPEQIAAEIFEILQKHL